MNTINLRAFINYEMRLIHTKALKKLDNNFFLQVYWNVSIVINYGLKIFMYFLSHEKFLLINYFFKSFFYFLHGSIFFQFLLYFGSLLSSVFLANQKICKGVVKLSNKMKSFGFALYYTFNIKLQLGGIFMKKSQELKFRSSNLNSIVRKRQGVKLIFQNCV